MEKKVTEIKQVRVNATLNMGEIKLEDIDLLQAQNLDTCVFVLTRDCKFRDYLTSGHSSRCFGNKYEECPQYLQNLWRYD